MTENGQVGSPPLIPCETEPLGAVELPEAKIISLQWLRAGVAHWAWGQMTKGMPTIQLASVGTTKPCTKVGRTFRPLLLFSSGQNPWVMVTSVPNTLTSCGSLKSKILPIFSLKYNKQVRLVSKQIWSSGWEFAGITFFVTVNMHPIFSKGK